MTAQQTSLPHTLESLDCDTAPSDAAPVYADDDPVGFLHKDDVTTDDGGNTLDTISDVLEHLQEGGHDPRTSATKEIQTSVGSE